MEKITKTESYRVEKICDSCKEGTLECTGTGVTKWSTDWEHKCSACGFTEWITGNSYPRTEYRDIGPVKKKEGGITMEKEIQFTTATSWESQSFETVKESDLTPEQLELLLGELINFHNKMPEIVKDIFLTKIHHQTSMADSGTRVARLINIF